MRQYYTFDLETYPNIFTFCGKFRSSSDVQLFEISDRKNQLPQLIEWLGYLRNIQVEMVGYNNIGFDYPIIHEAMINPYAFTYQRAAEMCQMIIESQKPFAKKLQSIKPQDRLIPQIDMMKLCHFDNKARRTSLKALQFNMRSESLEDLPFDIRPLNDQEKDILCSYNVHDVTETEKFFEKNEQLLEMRREYLESGALYGDILNYNDTKIGVEYFIKKIGRGKCYSGGKPRQTIRDFMEYKNIILPKIQFKTEQFNSVHSWFMQQSIYMSGKDRAKLQVDLAGLEFHFGVGGIHASADNKIFHSDDDYQIIDVDVTSMYPSVAIANRFAPEHLGETFVQVYQEVLTSRQNYAKGTSENAVLKLAANGVYGNSNNPYSPFYDPKYMLQVTLNGQLQLLQLVEMMDLIPDCELIQANTDGITLRVLKKNMPLLKMWCKVWEEMTGLNLEDVLYSRMWIKDVNNYIAETMDGKLKSKGAYNFPKSDKDYTGWWNKDYSNLAAKKACEKVLTDSWSTEIALRLCTNPFDFMMRYKATGKSQLFIDNVKQLKTVRYYVSTAGGKMTKVAPPKGEKGQYKRKNKLKDEYFNKIMKEIGNNVWDERIHSKNKSKYETVVTSVQAGWLVKQCNVATDFNWNDVDWNYYIETTKKLIIGSK